MMKRNTQSGQRKAARIINTLSRSPNKCQASVRLTNKVLLSVFVPLFIHEISGFQNLGFNLEKMDS